MLPNSVQSWIQGRKYTNNFMIRDSTTTSYAIAKIKGVLIKMRFATAMWTRKAHKIECEYMEWCAWKKAN